MQNSKLLLLLQALSTTELNRFQKFIDSPYFNADERLSRLFQFIRKKIKKDQLLSLERQDLFQEIWPNSPYSYARINQLLTELKRLLDRFLAVEHWQEKQFSHDFSLLQVAQERNWDHLYTQALRQAEKHLPQDFERPEEIHFQQFELARLADHHEVSRKDRGSDTHLQDVLHHLKAFSLLATLKHLCELLSRQHIIQKNELDDSILITIRQVEQQIQGFPDNAYVKLYGMLLHLLKGESEEANFKALQTYLIEKRAEITEVVRKDMHQYMRNFCIRKINQGQTVYHAELLGLYEEALATDLLWEDGFISNGEFKNIVSLGLCLKRLDWTGKFMEAYGKRIRPGAREAVLAYNTAHLLYAQGKLHEALRTLRTWNFEDVYYELGAKTLLLKIYFELEEETGLWALIHAFANYLRRNKQIAAYQKEVHLNFIKCLKKLERLRQRQDRMRKNAFKQAFEKLSADLQDARVNNRDWFEDQLKEMR